VVFVNKICHFLTQMLGKQICSVISTSFFILEFFVKIFISKIGGKKPTAYHNRLQGFPFAIL
jgi:hypothetical protein